MEAEGRMRRGWWMVEVEGREKREEGRYHGELVCVSLGQRYEHTGHLDVVPLGTTDVLCKVRENADGVVVCPVAVPDVVHLCSSRHSQCNPGQSITAGAPSTSTRT